jgi:hypothetical protein
MGQCVHIALIPPTAQVAPLAHRAIKPENLLFDAKRHPEVSEVFHDFGGKECGLNGLHLTSQIGDYEAATMYCLPLLLHKDHTLLRDG